MPNTIPFPATGVLVAGAVDSGADSGVIDITALRLTAPPSQAVFAGLGKASPGDANIIGSVIEGTMTATSVAFELDAPADNANRIPHILVIP